MRRAAVLAVSLAVAGGPPAYAAPAAPSLAGAQAFVEGIYKALALETFDYHQIAYAPALAGLMKRDEAHSDRIGGPAALEAVPFCACQDIAEDYRLLSVTVVRRGAKGARATVMLQNQGPQRFLIDVDWVGGGWRVADVHDPVEGSLLDYLRQEVPREEAEEKEN